MDTEMLYCDIQLIYKDRQIDRQRGREPQKDVTHEILWLFYKVYD